jgi:pyruvate dehydrogenase E1 component alpha subunit/2-oxoisovalerate dehydrogenase E1 component alpha subunit
MTKHQAHGELPVNLLEPWSVMREEGVVEAAEQVPAALRLSMYRHMLRVRAIDERMSGLQRQGRIGFYGAATGQEAPPVATALALQSNDWVFPALREGAVMLVRGFPLARYLAQLFGNDLDVLKGRQMPSHMSGRAVHQVSWSSVVGSQLPHAVGAAWAAKLCGDRTISVAFLGDGATSQSDFHSAMNFAAVFKTPCIFVCQNNQWAISTPLSRQTAASSLAVKASAYQMPARRVDGNDALAVYLSVRQAAEQARAGAGPCFIECVTYRMGAHSSSDDPGRYRPAGEVERWAAKDPILRLQQHLEQSGLLEADVREALLEEIGGELDRTIREVEARPRPSVETLFEDVYARPPWFLREEREELRRARGDSPLTQRPVDH